MATANGGKAAADLAKALFASAIESIELNHRGMPDHLKGAVLVTAIITMTSNAALVGGLSRDKLLELVGIAYDSAADRLLAKLVAKSEGGPA